MLEVCGLLRVQNPHNRIAKLKNQTSVIVPFALHFIFPLLSSLFYYNIPPGFIVDFSDNVVEPLGPLSKVPVSYIR